MRLLISLLTLVLLLATPASAKTGAGDQPRRVLVIESMTLPFIQETTGWVKAELAEQGFREAEDIDYEIFNIEGDTTLAVELLNRTLAERSPDLVLTVATLATRAVHEVFATSSIPHLFTIVADPVSAGLTPGFGQPSGNNVSGRSHVLSAETVLGQASRVLQRPYGEPLRIAVVGSTYPAARANMADLMQESRNLKGVELVFIDVPYRSGEDGRVAMRQDAVALVKSDPMGFDGFWLAVGPMAHDGETRAALTRETGAPIIYAQDVAAVREGALMAFTSNAEINGRAVGRMAAAALQGSDPGTMPVGRPDTFTAAFNVATALRLGLTLPSDLLELAGRQVYR